MKRYLITVMLFSTISVFGQDSLKIKQTSFKRLVIGINFSPDICYRTLKGSDDLSTRIADLYNKSDKPKFGCTAGINACYKISNHFGFEAGLQYSNKGYEYKIGDLTFGDQIDPRYGYVYATQTNMPRTVKFIYNWIYLDVPVRAIYSCGKQRIRFITSVGITTNILIKSTTTVIRKYENGDIKRTTQKQIDNFNSINLSPTASLGVDYRINNKINVRVEPTFRYGLLKIIDDPLKNHLLNGGLNISYYYALK